MFIEWFDVCAFFILFEVLYTCIVRRNLRVRQNYIFLIMLVVLMLTTIGSLFCTLGQNAVYLGNVSSPFYDIISMKVSVYLYMSMHIVTPMLFVIYMYSVLGIEYTKLWEFLVLFLPVVVALLFLAATPATGAIFYFDEYNVYTRGPAMPVFYAVAAYYVGYIIYLILYFRKSIRREVGISVCSFLFFSGAGVLVQFVNAHFKVEDFFNALVMIIVYITIERPGDFLDSQTDLQNQAAFYMNTETRLKRRSQMDMILISIDNLAFLDKQIGIAKSDMLLIEAAKFLASFSKSVTVYRLKRGVFILIMKSKAETTVENIMFEIRDRFKDAFTTEGYNILLYECCTQIICPKDADNNTDLNHLITLASSPEAHRNRHRYDVTEINLAEDNRKRTIDRILRSSVSDMSNIVIKYQPVYDVKTKKFDGVQLKTMFRSKELGALSRREYFAAAEGNGTAAVIEPYIYERLCSFIEYSGISHYGIRDFAIELPIGSLMMKGAADTIILAADEHGVPHHLITFELMEDALMNYQGIVRYNVEKLRERGFMFSLINYGRGYTDAGTILKMPLSSVTLDSALIAKGLENRMADTLLQSSVAMLKKFNIRIKADGIENEEQMKYASRLGCDMLQGYHLATVFSGDELLEYAKEGRNAV
ncbi:MAG: GGDEF domain-containing protein [Lachnospiraceae bacterium]|nr:GGDEF domain-containing protein [Lachnospiraceae bacterium]